MPAWVVVVSEAFHSTSILVLIVTAIVKNNWFFCSVVGADNGDGNGCDSCIGDNGNGCNGIDGINGSGGKTTIAMMMAKATTMAIAMTTVMATAMAMTTAIARYCVWLVAVPIQQSTNQIKLAGF